MLANCKQDQWENSLKVSKQLIPHLISYLGLLTRTVHLHYFALIINNDEVYDSYKRTESSGSVPFQEFFKWSIFVNVPFSRKKQAILYPGQIEVPYQQFWWPSQFKDIKEYFSIVPSVPGVLCLLHSISVHKCLWSHVVLDFVSNLLVSKAFTITLDRFFKACHLILLRKPLSSFQTA